MGDIPEWNPTADCLLDRMIHIYGESGTGKSFIIRHLMNILQRHIPQIKVFSPTNKQNHTYDQNDEVPRLFIHDAIGENALNDMWERQSAMKVTYDRANNIDTLQSLLARSGDAGAIRAVQGLKMQFAAQSAKLSESGGAAAAPKISDLRKAVEKSICQTCKSVISSRYSQLRSIPDLTENEKYAIKYRNFVPRLLLIFDDCTEQLKSSRNQDIFQKLFFQGRHMFITTIIAAHTDKTFSPELKKQVFISMFTAPECAASFIDLKSNGMEPAMRKKVHEIKSQIFTEDKPNQKMVWDRLEKKYYRYTAVPVEVQFCSAAVRKLADQVQRPADAVMKGNKYADRF